MLKWSSLTRSSVTTRIMITSFQPWPPTRLTLCRPFCARMVWVLQEFRLWRTIHHSANPRREPIHICTSDLRPHPNTFQIHAYLRTPKVPKRKSRNVCPQKRGPSNSPYIIHNQIFPQKTIHFGDVPFMETPICVCSFPICAVEFPQPW